MESFIIKECGLEDIEKVKDISKKTFYETFSEENTEEDMKNYLEENFSHNKLEKEIGNQGSKFYIVENDEEVAAYMKVNFDKAQTEPDHDNSLEVQRIYVLEKFKGKNIGKTLMKKTIEIGNDYNLNYIWLGVWEHNTGAIRFYEKLGFKKFDTHIFVLGEDEQTDYLMKFIL